MNTNRDKIDVKRKIPQTNCSIFATVFIKYLQLYPSKELSKFTPHPGKIPQYSGHKMQSKQHICI